MLTGFYAKTEAGATYAAFREDGRYFIVYGSSYYYVPYGCRLDQAALPKLIEVWHGTDTIAQTGPYHAIKEIL